MADLDLLLQSISALHDTCFDDTQWTPALASVGRLLRSFTVTAALESSQLEFPFVQSLGLSAEAIQDYAHEYNHIDPVIAYVRNAPVGVAYTDRMTIDDAAFVRTRFAQDFAKRYGMRPCLQAFTDRSQALSGFFCAARSTAEEDYTEADRGLAHALLPHLRQVFQIRRHLRHLEGQRLIALDMLDRLDQAAMLVDVDFRVVFANREGERLLGTAHGLSTNAGRLGAATAADTARLRRIIRQVINQSIDRETSPLVIKRPPPRHPLVLRIIPLPARSADGITQAYDLAFILVGDPDRRSRGEESGIDRVFDLTPTETRVASLLADGKSPMAIAGTMDISITTVRTHLANIFEKSDTKRQAELVSIIQRYRA